jgi:hypothetical protein
VLRDNRQHGTHLGRDPPQPTAASRSRVLAVLLRPEDFDGDSVIQLGRTPNRIDLLTQIDGVTFAECWPRRLQVVLDGTELQLIGLDDFKTNKRASGRLKDLADLEALEPPQED